MAQTGRSRTRGGKIMKDRVALEGLLRLFIYARLEMSRLNIPSTVYLTDMTITQLIEDYTGQTIEHIDEQGDLVQYAEKLLNESQEMAMN